MDALWRIEMLGELRAVQGDRVLTRFRTQQAGLLLAYLAYYPQRSHPRETLIELLWPECDPAAGRNDLRVALSSLRRQLELPGISPTTLLVTEGAAVRLRPAAFVSDVSQFEAALVAATHSQRATERAQRLAEAVELYRGELLPGHFEPWVLLERERLAEAYLQALAQLADLLDQCGDLPEAIRWARRRVMADPLLEESHYELIRLLAAAGELGSALGQYEQLEQRLAGELCAVPSADTRALVEAIRRQAVVHPIDTGSAAIVPRIPGHPTGRWGPGQEQQRDPENHAAVPSAPRSATSSIPSGTVTFLLIEVTGGPMPGQEIRSGSAAPRSSGRFVLDRPFALPAGAVVQETPDSIVLAFGEARHALATAAAAQRAVQGWQVRMALHTGDVEAGEALAGPALQHGMRLLLAGCDGQILVSAVTAALLRDELGPDQRLIDRGLYRLRGHDPPERLFELVDNSAPATELLPLQAPFVLEGSLPLQSTRFFGRQGEMARLGEAIRAARENQEGDSPRLITLTGPGGCGKTRLAFAVAARLQEEKIGGFPLATWFVPLQDLVDPRLILDRVLQTVQLPRSPHLEPLEQLATFFSRRPALLVLDNFEQLLPDGAAIMHSLQDRVDILLLLVTSRQRLNLEGEREYPVAPLPVPDLRDEGRGTTDESRLAGSSSLIPHLSSLLACPSIQLFLDRAQAVRPEFQLTASNAAAVATLCRRLDGLPLAIELAAARCGVLTPQRMLERLSERFTLLARGRRDPTRRHQSLRAALDWSYQLLSPELRQFFARLSIFRGGWTAEAAAEILDFGFPILDWIGKAIRRQALDSAEKAKIQSLKSKMQEVLNQLKACSMVLELEGAEPRYSMLETLREFGAEQLTAAERADLARRHVLYYLQLAELAVWGLHGAEHATWLAEWGLHGADPATWLVRLEREHDNFRAALDWCVASAAQEGHSEPVERPSPARLALELGGALGRFWNIRGNHVEARERLKQVLALPGTGARSLARARALARLGSVSQRTADWPEVPRTLYEESLAIYREHGDVPSICHAQGALGGMAHSLEDYGTARAHFQEFFDLSSRVGYRLGIAHALFGLSDVARAHGDLTTAVSLAHQFVELRRELGDKLEIAHSLGHLANMLHHEGDYTTARAHLHESLALERELGDKPRLVEVLIILGHVSRCLEDYPAAQAAYQEGLDLLREIGEEWTIARVLSYLGAVAQRRGDHRQAIALVHESLEQYRDLGRRPSTPDSLRQQSLQFQALGVSWLAGVAAGMGQPERAACLLGAAEAVFEAVGARLWPAERIDFDHNVAALRAALDHAAFAAAWARGRETPLEQAITDALRLSAEH